MSNHDQIVYADELSSCRGFESLAPILFSVVVLYWTDNGIAGILVGFRQEFWDTQEQ